MPDNYYPDIPNESIDDGINPEVDNSADFIPDLNDMSEEAKRIAFLSGRSSVRYEDMPVKCPHAGMSPQAWDRWRQVTAEKEAAGGWSNYMAQNEAAMRQRRARKRLY